MTSLRWSTRLAFYLAAMGSALGLGNIWRFPFIVADNGGGAFVWLYLLMVFVVGMPLLIGELLLGKVTGSAIVPALKKLDHREVNPYALTEEPNRGGIRVWAASYLAITSCVLVLSYYSVISGWVLHFLFRLTVGLVSERGFDPEESLLVLMDKSWLQVLLTSAHLFIVAYFVGQRLHEGFERWIGKIVPLYFVFLVLLASQALSMQGASDALRFFLYPNFANLTWDSLGKTIGHVCFTLSVGFGMMVTFGSYVKDTTSVPVAGFRIAIFDSLVSLFVGMIVFPLMYVSSAQAYGPPLLFQTVPSLLVKMGGGEWLNLIFFLCLYLAALGASVGLMETAVANWRESKHVSHNKATKLMVGLCLVVGLFPALSTGVFGHVRFGDLGLLEIWDSLVVHWLLPVSALVISQVVVHKVDKSVQKQEFDVTQNSSVARLYRHWRWMMTYLVPGLIICGLLLQVFAR